jgi:hypothetical protein
VKMGGGGWWGIVEIITDCRYAFNEVDRYGMTLEISLY